jgi:GR25 family glycosyltransferase involved in LPS biosynthesis
MKIDQFFQKGFYINLDRRTDRRNYFESEIAKIGLKDFFERFPAHDYMGEMNPEDDQFKKHSYCGSSYHRLFKKILEEGYERVVIFEDDISVYNDGPKPALQIIEDSLDEIQNFPDWDLLYFGGHIIGSMLKVSDNLSKPENILAMHAVGYNRKGIEKMIEYKPFLDGAIDGWMSARANINKYSTNFLAVAQADGISDLDASGISVGPSAFAESYKRANFLTSPSGKSLSLDKNFITPRLQGRTGNIMFQIAYSYVKSLRHDRQLVIPSKEAATSHLEKGLFRKFDFIIEKTPMGDSAKQIWGPFTYGETEHPEDDKPTVYAGWYQSEKFFGEYKNTIRNVFSPTPEFVETAFKDYPSLKDKTVVAINVRRGDYLTQPRRHPVVTKEFIDVAITKLPVHDIKFVVSDDIEWCKQNLNYENTVFVDKYYDQEALWLLSLCSHFIISNSTFSWWGAWLSRNKNKVVIAPSTWFGPDVSENPMHIICEDWIKLPTKWVDGFIYPE